MNIKTTEPKLAAAFTEWERRYREEPERFMSEAAKLLKETPETYGQACAPYLIQILDELETKPKHGVSALDSIASQVQKNQEVSTLIDFPFNPSITTGKP